MNIPIRLIILKDDPFFKIFSNNIKKKNLIKFSIKS